MNEITITKEVVEQVGILALLAAMFGLIIFILVRQFTPMMDRSIEAQKQSVDAQRQSIEAQRQSIEAQKQSNMAYNKAMEIMTGLTAALSASTTAIEGARLSDAAQSAALVTLTETVTDGFTTANTAIAGVEPSISIDLEALRTHMDAQFSAASTVTVETAHQLHETLSPMSDDLIKLLKEAQAHKAASEERNRKLMEDIQLMIVKVSIIEGMVTPSGSIPVLQTQPGIQPSD